MIYDLLTWGAYHYSITEIIIYFEVYFVLKLLSGRTQTHTRTSKVPVSTGYRAESTHFVSSSTSFWYQFLHFQLTYSFIHHFFLLGFTNMHIHNSLCLTPCLKVKTYRRSVCLSSVTLVHPTQPVKIFGIFFTIR